MIFFVSFYDKHPFDFDSPKVITSPILVSTPILSVIGPSAIIESNSGNNFSHNWFFLVTYKKKNSEQSR